MLRLSYSSISEFQLCPRRYYYNRVERRVRKGGNDRSLGFGLAFHAAQEVLWSHAGTPEEALPDVLAAWHAAAQLEQLSFEDTLLGEVLLIGYAIRWDDLRLTTQMLPVVEERAVVPVLDYAGNPDPDLELVIVLDARCLDEDGNTVPIEHKTTSSPIDEGGPYWRRMDDSQQVSLYYLALTDAGHRVGHVLLDVVRAPQLTKFTATPVEKREFYVRNGKWGKAGDPKPGTRLQDETADEFATRVREMILNDPNAYYARHKLYRDDEELARVRADLWQQGQLMKHALDADLFPRNKPSACFAFNRECPYKPVCDGQTDITDERLYAIRPREKAEELWR